MERKKINNYCRRIAIRKKEEKGGNSNKIIPFLPFYAKHIWYMEFWKGISSGDTLTPAKKWFVLIEFIADFYLKAPLYRSEQWGRNSVQNISFFVYIRIQTYFQVVYEVSKANYVFHLRVTS